MDKCALFALLLVLGAQAQPQRAPKIINGHSATHQPYNAFIMYLNAQNAGFFGGGSLISDRHVLTAAINIFGYQRWNVGLGSNIFTQLATITSTQAIAHPNFNPTNRANDIGVIMLPSSVVFTTYVYPIRLPPLTYINQLPVENEEGTIVGFGFTSSSSTTRADYLMHSFQRVVNHNRCLQFFPVQSPYQFCAEDNIERSNVCNGDLGAGFVTIERGRPILTGIASLVAQNCGAQNPTGYTRIAAYRQWIHQVAYI
ncbi:chymotrypsin-like [Toxorhynchites rutilus septentrionalis]|uniref:chymotrypsin-like n=1 Tax=Toxorhynchites rutilus septentrionalis TaxID=329112 RepID=UPI0024795023|nr:chymotrypsin-like [Toxorhynchites rutilus septentrionalis]